MSAVDVSSSDTADAAVVYGSLFGVTYALMYLFMVATRFLPMAGAHRMVLCCSDRRSGFLVRAVAWAFATAILAAPVVFLALWAAFSTSGEEHVVALLGGTVGLFVLLMTHLGQRRWNPSSGAVLMAVCLVLLLLAAPGVAIYALNADDREFSFRALSCAFLAVNLLAVAFIAYRGQPALRLKDLLGRLFDAEEEEEEDEAPEELEEDGGGGAQAAAPAAARPGSRSRRAFSAVQVVHLAVALLLDVGLLVGYAYTVDRLTPDGSDAGDESASTGARHVGWIVSCGVLVYDALLACVVRMRLLRVSPLGVIGAAFLCRLGLIVFGQSAWFVGQSLLFVVFFWLVAFEAVRRFYPVEGREGTLAAFRYARNVVLREADPSAAPHDAGAGAPAPDVVVEVQAESRKLRPSSGLGVVAALLAVMTVLFATLLALVSSDVLWAPPTVHDGGSRDLEQRAYGWFALVVAFGGTALYFALRSFAYAAERTGAVDGFFRHFLLSAAVCGALAGGGVALHAAFDARALASTLYFWPLAAVMGTALWGLWHGADMQLLVRAVAPPPPPLPPAVAEAAAANAGDDHDDDEAKEDGGDAAPPAEAESAPVQRGAGLTLKAKSVDDQLAGAPVLRALRGAARACRVEPRNAVFVAALLVLLGALAAQGAFLYAEVGTADGLAATLALAPAAVLLTVVPLVSYFHLRAFRADICAFFCAGAACLIGYAAWLADVVGDARPYYYALLLFPAALFVLLGLAVSRASGWRLSRPAAASFALSLALLLAYTGVLLHDDTDAGLAFLFAVAALSYLAAVTGVWVSAGFRLPRYLAWGTLFLLAVVIAAATTVAVRSDRVFRGVSVAWLGVATLMVAYGVYRLVDTSNSRTLYSHAYFPVLRYEIDSGRVASNNAAAVSLLGGAMLAFSWGLLASEELGSPLAGLATAAAVVLATAVYMLWAIHSAGIGLARASEHLSRSVVRDLRDKAARKLLGEGGGGGGGGAPEQSVARPDLEAPTMRRFAEAGLLPHLLLPKRRQQYAEALGNFYELGGGDIGARHSALLEAQRRYDAKFAQETAFLNYYALLLTLSGEFLEQQLAKDVVDFANSLRLGGEGVSVTAADVESWSPAVLDALRKHLLAVRRRRERRDRVLKRQLQAGGGGGKRSKVNVCGSIFPLLAPGDEARAERFVAEQVAQLRAIGQKFVDEDMPPYAVRGKYDRWARATEVWPDASLFSGRPSADDVKQGALGDCWLHAAFAIAAASEPGSVEAVFLCADTALSAGMALVRLHFDGVWWAVAVDDRLPVQSDGRTLALGSSATEGELWVPLLEKACAKLFGSSDGYEQLAGGSSAEALTLMTGNPSKTMQLQATSAAVISGALWKTFVRMHDAGFFLGVASAGESDDQVSEQGNIVQNHAFSLLDVREVGGFRLLQVRNPWGTGEWTGEWSDESDMWRRHPAVAAELHHKVADDGIFWIAYEQFLLHYDLAYLAFARRPHETVVTFQDDVELARYTGGSRGEVSQHCPQAWLTVTRPVDVALRVRVPPPSRGGDGGGGDGGGGGDDEDRTVFVLAVDEGGRYRLRGVSYSDPCLYLPKERLSDNNITFVAEPGVFCLAVLFSGGRREDLFPLRLSVITREEDADAVRLERTPASASVRDTTGDKVFARFS